ncbi:hypothetical protein [Streptomyces longisporoflavus]|uniref:hypothetical protein n=1 Tax=Streptomyces longisporoflavus TaxID=28044 RepID=UPI00167C7ECB|nr:hypothetical protein [Streptomyces longisporoflavus]
MSPRGTPVRTLLLPLFQEALEGLFHLETLLLRLRNVLVLNHRGELLDVMGYAGVPIPGAPIEDVSEAYWRVRAALPEGTEEFADGALEEYPPTANVLLLAGPCDGGRVMHLTTLDVAEADLTLLTESADALDRAAGPRPGPEFEALTEALGELGRVPYYSWMPSGDEGTIARWVRRALSAVLYSPFEGPHGAADHETLSNVLRYAEGREYVEVDEDEEQAAERVLASMMRAALDDLAVEDEVEATTRPRTAHEHDQHGRRRRMTTEELTFDEQDELVVLLSTGFGRCPRTNSRPPSESSTGPTSSKSRMPSASSPAEPSAPAIGISRHEGAPAARSAARAELVSVCRVGPSDDLFLLGDHHGH